MNEVTEELADRIRALIGHKPGVVEKRMFGGYGWMLHGNMVVGAMGTGALLMRVGPDNHATAKKRPGARPMIQGGREMKGFIEVTDEGIDDDDALKATVDYAWAYVRTMPPKAEGPAKPAKKAPTNKAPARKSPAKKR
ncbi:MAG: TfoX/Sxy family protein [Devosia sp.]